MSELRSRVLTAAIGPKRPYKAHEASAALNAAREALLFAQARIVSVGTNRAAEMDPDFERSFAMAKGMDTAIGTVNEILTAMLGDLEERAIG